MAVISSNRKMDWSYAGVTGGIPTNYTPEGAIITASATASDINTRIANAPANTYLEFAAGTFTLNDALDISRSNVILRGQGMSTIFNFTGKGGWFFYGDCLIAVQSSGIDLSGYLSAPGITGVTSTTPQNWTGTNGSPGVYTQGATVLNITSTTGLSAGMTLTLWQLDPADTDLPDTGYFVSDKAGHADQDNICWQGSGQTQNTGITQRCRIVSVDSSTQVTIAAPGIHRPEGMWASRSLQPRAGWNDGTITGVGIENIKITHNQAGVEFMIGFDVAADCWVTGCGFQPPVAADAGDFCIALIDSRNMEVRDNWIDEFAGGGISTTTSYGVALSQVSDSRVQNNIFNKVESPLEMLSGSTGNVTAYNYEYYVSGEGGMQPHEVGASMNLYEGNIVIKFWADEFHGNTTMNTIFRNNFYIRGIDLWTYHRWYSMVGNVIKADDVYKTIYSDATLYSRSDDYAFRLGYASQAAYAGSEGDPPPNYYTYPDAMVATTAMIWGNVKVVSGVATAVFDSAEVPSSDPLFPNPVPPDNALPNSYYLSGEPDFWGNVTSPFPPIGPDVAGGDISGFGGHVYTIPAKQMYEDKGGSIALFAPEEYYVESSVTQILMGQVLL